MGPAWEVKISFIGTMLKPPVVPGCAMLHVLQHVSDVRAARLYALRPCTKFIHMYEQSVPKLVGGVTSTCFVKENGRSDMSKDGWLVATQIWRSA